MPSCPPLTLTGAVDRTQALAMKLPFDYFVICKPVVEPLKVVVLRNWLECKSKW